MRRYDPGDMATFYFVIEDSKNVNVSSIKGWTDSKSLAEFYMDFHKCPRFRIKKVYKAIEEINKIIDNNYYDEINIYNIIVKDESDVDNKKIISIPMTMTEMTVINDECDMYFNGTIDYTFLNESICYLKNKYLEALNDIMLIPVINKITTNKSNKYLDNIDMDQGMVLIRSFPDSFGI